MDRFDTDRGNWYICYPGRPEYFTHWGGASKYAASVLGPSVASYPESLALQVVLPNTAKVQIRRAYENLGLLSD